MSIPYPQSIKYPLKTVVNPVSVALLVTLLLLRIPFYGGMNLLFGGVSWVSISFDVGTYLLTAILIWLERERLADFHFTPLALWIFLIMKPLSTVLVALMGDKEGLLTFPHPLSFSFLLISVGLFIALRRSGFLPGKTYAGEWKWLGLGGLAGLGVAILLSFPLALALRDFGAVNYNPLSDWAMILLRVPQQMGYAAVTEEPVFRGFLWGFLRRAGWKHSWILIFQTALFTLAHIYYLKTFPFSFWVVVPFGALVLGGLVWRSRNLASSLGCHAVMNAFGLFLSQLARVWFLKG